MTDYLAKIGEQHLSILGKVGSGKTFTAKGIVEKLLAAGRRVCIIDPTGVWWGLRALKDGEPSAFPVVIFGGEHADVPIDKGSGERLATVLAGANVPELADTPARADGDLPLFAEVKG